MNINFENLRVFCTVAESKSITEATQKLHVSQPAITKTIKMLEDELKTILFYRSHYGMQLTKDGNKLYSYIKPLILQVDDTKNIMGEMLNDEKINLRIGTSNTILRSFLIDYIRSYNKEHPNVLIYVEDNTNNNLITKIKEGSLDIAIMVSSPNYTKKYSNINIYKLSELNYALFCNKEYLQENEKINSIKSVKAKNIIINRNTTELNKILTNHNLNNYLTVSSNSLVIDFIKKGLGIGLAIKEFVNNYEGLYELKVKENLPIVELIIVTNNNKYQNIFIMYFINGLIEKFKT